MCSVSASPVMKMTGTLLKPASRLRRRHVSKPSMPGITASSRMTSGVIWSTMRMAAAPSMATMTVMPAPSSASVRSRSVSGESSTMSATSRFLASVIIAVQRLQGCHELIEIETVDQRPHLRNEVGVFGIVRSYFIQLELDRANIAQLPKTDQLLDMLNRRTRAAVRLPVRDGALVGLVLPFDLEELADQFQKPWNVDRLHQIAVVEWLRQRRAMCLQGTRRNHQDTGLMMAGRAQRFSNRPTIHARHRNVEQEQIGTAMLREGEAGRSIRRAEQDEAERRQYLTQEIALDGIVVGNQDRLARAVIAEDGRVDRRNARRVGHFRQQNLHPEGAAGADRTRDLDIAAHHAREQPADGQPQAGPGLRLRDPERTAFERREDAFKVTRLNS